MNLFTKKTICGLLCALGIQGLHAQTTIVPMGSSWKYLDNGSNQGTAWCGTSFNDGTWVSGNAQLGYGDGDETTVVSYGPNSSAKYTTTYFRKTISVADASIFTSYTLNVKRDDGIVVYVNGVEKYRNNMPTGTIAFNTWASTACSDDGGTTLSTTLPSGSLSTGTNVIAIEIHQSGGTSSDISFDFSLIGNSTVDVTAPLVSTLSPVDNATGVANTSNLVMTFNENVQKGTGSILIKEGGVTTQTINVTSTAVTVSGATVTIDPSNLTLGAAVNIEMPAGTFKDMSNNNYAGITNATTWNFGVSTSAPTATLSRGPYLQMGTSSSVVIRWRSNIATDTKVSYGLSPTTLTQSVSNGTSLTDHEIQITGLTPNTKYYYSIGSSTQTLQGDANNFFTTAPLIGTEQFTRVWVTGDCGNNSTNQVNVRNQYHSYIGSNNTDVWLLLGDNAYSGGLDNEYQSKFYDIYKDKMLKQTVLWPAPGNHDYNSSATLQNTHNMPYYDMFTMPTAGQVGGVASGTEAFYSYNYANIHFVALDSYGKESNQYRMYDTLGPQAVWLKQDLAANTQKWIVVYWHHPPYTMGSHNSDSESDLAAIRANFIKILERYKVDLILCGHSHCYERSKLMKGHFGNESSFSAGTHNLSTQSAKYDGTASSCPYVKNSVTNYNGTVYVVAGSAGQLGGTQASWPHNAMHYSNATNGGSMALEFESNRLTAKWICADGVIRDQFTIMKDVNKTTNITISQGQNVNLTSSWVGNYNWSTGATTRTINVAPTSSTSYSVNDGVSCLNDVFNVTVTTSMQQADVPTLMSAEESLSLKIYPNPVVNKSTIEFTTPFVNEISLEMVDLNGKLIKSFTNGMLDNGLYKFNLDPTADGIKDGTYFIKLIFGEHSISEKIVIKN